MAKEQVKPKKVKAKVQRIATISKKLKTQMTTNRLDCRGNANIFCEQSGTATVKITMPDGSTHDLMEIDTNVTGDNISSIKVKVRALPISRDVIEIIE